MVLIKVIFILKAKSSGKKVSKLGTTQRIAQAKLAPLGRESSRATARIWVQGLTDKVKVLHHRFRSSDMVGSRWIRQNGVRYGRVPSSATSGRQGRQQPKLDKWPGQGQESSLEIKIRSSRPRCHGHGRAVMWWDGPSRSVLSLHSHTVSILQKKCNQTRVWSSSYCSTMMLSSLVGSTYH